MTLPALFCDGARLQLTERLGRGGEGEVYALADGSNRAVKVYHTPDAVRAAKVQALVTAGLSYTCKDIAFPLGIVRSTEGKFAGFTMKKVRDHLPIYELTGTASRRQHFPHADWRFLVRVARNVAGIVATVHRAGVTIGDVNSAGFLVSQQATVTLIDADSFQFGAYRCRVGMPEYTPAELQGKRFDEVNRTADHDAFGLAVLLFQILALGRHPYAGVASGRAVQIDAAIVQGRFCYSMIRKIGAVPPPGTIGLSDFPAAVRFLFERAFAPRPGRRPSAAEWVVALIRLEQDLGSCIDQPAHVIPSLVTPCPWCRIERQTGRHIFLRSVAPRSSVPSVLPIYARVASAIEHAKRFAGETVVPMWSRPEVVPGKAAMKMLASDGPIGPLHRLHFQLNPTAGPVGKFVERYDAARADAKRAMEEWRTRLGIWDIARLVDGLRSDLARLDRVALHRPVLLAQASSKITEQEIQARLATVPISGALISGIGSGLCSLLAGKGIVSAADIDRCALEAVSGIGESRIVALLFWRAALAIAAEQKIVDIAVDARLASARRMAEDISARLEASIDVRLAALDVMVARVRKRVWLVDFALQDAFRARDEAEADLKYLGIDEATLRSVTASAPVSPPPARNTKSKSKQAKKQVQVCPRCGAAMVKRWSNGAAGQGRLFRGCSTYPRCNGSRPIHKKGATP